MKSDFVQVGRAEMHEYIEKAIYGLLDVLDSKIEFPEDKNGKILYSKLFAVVQAREQVWISTTELMDLAGIDNHSDKKYLGKILSGFETTWHEMTRIVCMNIGEYTPSFGELLLDSKLSEEDKQQIARESVTDDRLSSISKAKVLAAKLSYQILDRIEKLTNPDAFNEQLLQKAQTAGIIENYAENR